jgi:hypothetical protein
MEGTRFDHLARALATSGSRRRVLGAVLVGALGSLWTRATAADDSGTAIADASGGDHNLATVVDPATGEHDRNRDNNSDKDRDDEREHDRGDDKNKNKDKDKDKDSGEQGNSDQGSGAAVCPPGSDVFCCQCTVPVRACTPQDEPITDCPSECGIGNSFEVLEAAPGQEFTCVGNTCTPGPC